MGEGRGVEEEKEDGGEAVQGPEREVPACLTARPMARLGGGGWMQVFHTASGDHKILDYCGQCPAAADLASGRFDTPGAKTLGILAPVRVPLALSLWYFFDVSGERAAP